MGNSGNQECQTTGAHPDGVSYGSGHLCASAFICGSFSDPCPSVPSAAALSDSAAQLREVPIAPANRIRLLTSAATAGDGPALATISVD